MDETLLSDLSSYKSYKDKAVMMAARSLIQLFRTLCPDLLHKKDRGRPTEASAELGQRKFGQLQATEFVPGGWKVLWSAQVQCGQMSLRKTGQSVAQPVFCRY
jgi:protein SDA1